MGGKTVKLSNHVWNDLDAIKKRNGHKSYDSVIRYLLLKEKGYVCLIPKQTTGKDFETVSVKIPEKDARAGGD